MFFLIGCATREDAVTLDNRAYSLEDQISNLGESNAEFKASLSKQITEAEKKMDSALQPIHQAQAQNTAQIEALKTQIQNLQGRIENLQYTQKKEQNQFRVTLLNELKEIRARLNRLKQPPSSSPPTPASSPQPGWAEAKPEKAKETTPNPQMDHKEIKEPAEEKEKPKATPEEIFSEAEVMLKKKVFTEARQKYEEYLKMAPKGKNVEEARFGLSESLFEVKDYEEAILSYQKLIKSFPKSKYVPAALYKQALSFLALEDSDSAKLLLEEIIKRYPRSSQAHLAREKLKSS
jgi:tol-pal system protein YbgF